MVQKILTTSLINTPPITKISYANPPLMCDYSHIKTTPPFCHKWQRVSISSRHLIITRWASTIVLISTITARAIITLSLGSQWRWRRSNSETTHDSLLSCDTTNMGVHLTQLIIENVKASIHAHKLCHDGLKCHSICRRWRSGGGWSGRSWRSCSLCPVPLQSELCLALSNGSCIYGTYHWKVRSLGKGDRKMAGNPRDSWRKTKLIMGRRIPIDIYKE